MEGSSRGPELLSRLFTYGRSLSRGSICQFLLQGAHSVCKELKMSHFNTMRAKRAKFIIKLLLNNFEGEFRCWKIGDTIFSAIIQMRLFW